MREITAIGRKSESKGLARKRYTVRKGKKSAVDKTQKAVILKKDWFLWL